LIDDLETATGVPVLKHFEKAYKEAGRAFFSKCNMIESVLWADIKGHE